jgi:hypothetical protein
MILTMDCRRPFSHGGLRWKEGIILPDLHLVIIPCLPTCPEIGAGWRSKN